MFYLIHPAARAYQPNRRDIPGVQSETLRQTIPDHCTQYIPQMAVCVKENVTALVTNLAQ